MASKGRESLGGASLEDYATSNTSSIKQLDNLVAKLRAQGESVSASEVANIANQLIKSGQYKTEPSVAGKMLKKMLNSDLAKAIAGKGKKTATSSMEAAQGQAEDAKKKNKGGSISKVVKGNTGMLASKKNLKPIPAGNKGKGLSKLDKSVRNNMGFMYGGGMPMPSKKPRMSTTDYRKAANGMLILSIDMKKKKPKIKKNKRG